jgi:hypothetical protein
LPRWRIRSASSVAILSKQRLDGVDIASRPRFDVRVDEFTDALVAEQAQRSHAARSDANYRWSLSAHVPQRASPPLRARTSSAAVTNPARTSTRRA